MAAPRTEPTPQTPVWQQLLRPRAALSPGQARGLVLLMAGLHVAAAWGLLQLPAVQDAVRDVAPTVVDLVTAPVPPAPPLSPPRADPPRPKSAPQPVLVAPTAAPVPTEVYTAPAPPPDVRAEPVATAPVAEATATAAPSPAPPSPPPPARRRVESSAVQYLVLPPVEVPRASRRAGESGVVWLRVVVDVRGLPAQVKVHRSSGHARLDEQAVWAMRQARFKPQTEDGAAIELEVIAPIDYPQE